MFVSQRISYKIHFIIIIPLMRHLRKSLENFSSFSYLHQHEPYTHITQINCSVSPFYNLKMYKMELETKRIKTKQGSYFITAMVSLSSHIYIYMWQGNSRETMRAFDCELTLYNN